MPIGTDPQDSPLPSGGATAANQTTEITHLSAIEIATEATEVATESLDGKLPTAATPADAVSNTASLTRMLAWLQGFNGTTWDRLKVGVSDFTSNVLSTFTGTLRNFPLVQYLSTRPTLTTGTASTLQANTRGDLAVQEQYAPTAEDNTNNVIWTAPRALSASTGAWSNYASGTTLIGTAGHNVKASAGRLRGIIGANTSATTNYYLVGVNKASAPVANDATVFAIPLSANTTFGTSTQALDFGPDGLYLATGVSFAISTTPEKVTLAGSTMCSVWAQYL